MMLSIKRLCREPLIHFLTIGVILFALYDLTQGAENGAPNRIIVGDSQIDMLSANFKRARMRLPTGSELDALIEHFIREEIFYREALAMGLDQDDILVRRRMRLKLEFILEDLSSKTITDEDLATFLQENPDKFRREPQLSFQQVYLNQHKRKTTDSEITQLLLSLNTGAVPESVGDPTLLPADYNLAGEQLILRDFGEQFTQGIIKLKPGDWLGPIHSVFGVHLIKITARIDASQPMLADVRQLVENEYIVEQRKQQKEIAYQELRENYQVIVDTAKTDTTQASAL